MFGISPKQAQYLENLRLKSRRSGPRYNTVAKLGLRSLRR